MLYYLDCFHRKRDISGIVMIVRVILRKNECSIHHNLVINGKIFLSKSEILSNLSKDNKYSIEEVAFNLVKCDKMHLIDANLYTQGNTIKSAQSDIYGLTCYGEQFIKEN